MSEQKAMYDVDYRYTTAAIHLDTATNNALAKIFASYIARGYSPNDISSIMHRVVFDLATEAIIEKSKEGQTK